jgi:hypothetical protein
VAPRRTIKFVSHELYAVNDKPNVNDTGIPHAATNNDVYNGYFIPQGMKCLITCSLLIDMHQGLRL